MSHALRLQQRWNDAEITRFEVVGSFVDFITDTIDNKTSNFDEGLLNHLHIYTVTKDNGGQVTTPKSISHLGSLLRATIWIPFITGEGLWYQDNETGQFHIDGGFGTSLYPQFETSLYTPVEMATDIMMNLFNMNVSPDLAHSYWTKGFFYGI